MKAGSCNTIITAFICCLVAVTLGWAQVEFEEHVLRQGFDGAQSIHAADIDGDGDVDIVAAAPYANLLAWWENDGEQDFEEHAIANFAGACFPIPVDFDFDDDIDIVCSGRNGGFHWWENNGDAEFEQRNIDGGHSCWEIDVYDVDGDGDWDVLASGGRVSWYENDGDFGFDEHQLGGNFNNSRSVNACDVDSDGDVDIIASDHSNRMVGWWENDGEQDFEQHIISNNAPQAWDIMGADVDQDGDMDVLCAIEGRDIIVWWENDGDEGFEEHIIDNDCPTAGGVYVADLDMDGDTDVLGACYRANTIDWYENDGDQNYEEHNIGRNFGNPWRVYPHDVDLDGDLDVLGAAWDGDELRWWENQLDPEVALEVAPEEMDFGGVDLVVDRRLDLTIMYNPDEDHGINLILEFQIVEGAEWLSVDPETVPLAIDDTVTVEAVVSFPDEFDLGEYGGLIRIVPNRVGRWSVEVPVSVVAVSGDGILRGRVTEAEDGTPIEGARLSLEGFRYEEFTDDQGYYTFDGVAFWEYTLIAEKEDFLRHVVENVVVEEEEETVVNIALDYATFTPSRDDIFETMQPDDEMELPFTIHNGGNGPLTWSMEKVFPGGGGIDPWVFRGGFAAGDSAGDNRLAGVEFVGGNFYLAGGAGRADLSLIYIFDCDGNCLDQFPQFAESRYGMRDLAWDGRLLWGVDGNTIYGFTTDGNLIHELDSPINSARYIAYDPDRRALWVSSVTTNIVGINLDGEEIGTIHRPPDTHMYGLSWFPEDLDGYNLYVFTNDGDYHQQVHKINPGTDESMYVCDLPDVEGARAGGLAISGLWDPYSWVFMSMLDGPDVLAIWQLAPRTDWLDAAPVAGVIEPDGDVELTVTFNSLGLPVDEEFEADLVFSHDGIGSETVIPVALFITDVGGVSPRVMHFDLGWNMVSVNVLLPEDSVEVIMRPLVEEGLLEIMKDGDGHFYIPSFHYNDIPGWRVDEGYQVKVNQACELEVEGEVIAWDTPIELRDGWQLVSYYPRVAVDATVALAGIEEHLLLAKDAWGHFYYPAMGFSDIGDMVEGQGYQLKLDGERELVYRLGDEVVCRSGAPVVLPPYFKPVAPTGSNMSLLVLADDSYAGCELGVFSPEGRLVGSSVFDAVGCCGVAVWGDDPTTGEIDGMLPGEPLELVIFRNSTRQKASFETLAGDGFYSVDDMLVAEITGSSFIPQEFGILAAYPNPFNSFVRLTYGLTSASQIDFSLFDVSGRCVLQMVSGYKSAGIHSFVLDGAELSNGVYFARLQADGNREFTKLALIK